MKVPLTRSGNPTLLLVQPDDPAPRFLVVALDPRQVTVQLKGQLVRDESISLAAQLRNRLDEESIRCSQAALLLSRPQVEFFSARLPPASDHELPALVENFVAQETDDSDGRVIDFLITGGDDETTTDVLALTCQRELVNASLREFKEAGFRLRAVTYRGFGSVQLIQQVAHQKLPITIAITSTDSSTDIAVMQHRKPVMFRTVQRGLTADESYAAALAAEVQRTLAFVGAGDEDSALIYLIGDKSELGSVAEVLSDTVSSSVTITGVRDRVDDTAVAPFEDAAGYAQLIGMASAIAQDRLPSNFLAPRRAAPSPRPWRRYAAIAVAAVAVLGSAFYVASTERRAQLAQIARQQATLDKLARRVNQATELQDVVDSVRQWQQTDITWLDELKDLSERFPERSESLVKKMTMSAAEQGVGVIDLSVQVNSPEVITALESAIRDDRHRVSSKRVTEVNDTEQLTWSFETRIVFQPLPKPENLLPEPLQDVEVEP